MKKLEKDSAWHNFTWDLPDDFDSLTGISFSYQHNVISTDSTLGVIKLRNLCCDSDLVGISGPIQTQNPKSFELSQNYPNPFNPSTKIKFAVPAVSYVSLIVFNSLGQEVQTLVREEKSEGIYEVSFNASNLPSGTYFYRLQAGSFVETKKMILMK
ncbi:MAG: hypothetical protein CO025_06430 [Ignavibacteria bacterium CG_4_9_14_0_2_um_filter_37_13]|nr:MAG: hypothetical protein CO025_06430 [Ignavibacteria bacterium CG_4_9_14_0_2_um_filter_37_13]